MDADTLVNEARQLREKWQTGAYVSITAAISLANRLADAIEEPRDGGRSGSAK